MTKINRKLESKIQDIEEELKMTETTQEYATRLQKAIKLLIEEEIEKHGYCEILSGVYLQTQEYIIDDQKSSWNDTDEFIDYDFTTNNFWLTYSEMEEPEGFGSVKECMESLIEEGHFEELKETEEEEN